VETPRLAVVSFTWKYKDNMTGISTKNKALQSAAVATGNGEVIDVVQLSGV
jgi:hypothetical protein